MTFSERLLALNGSESLSSCLGRGLIPEGQRSAPNNTGQAAARLTQLASLSKNWATVRSASISNGYLKGVRTRWRHQGRFRPLCAENGRTACPWRSRRHSRAAWTSPSWDSADS